MSTADEVQSGILKALADENRIRLLRLLSREVLNVQELCEILACPQPRVSRHLSVLRKMGLVKDQREGSRVYYRMAELDGELAMISSYLEEVAGQDHPDLERLEQVLHRRTRESHDFAREQADQWDFVGSQLHSSHAALLAFAMMASGSRVVADLGAGTGIMLPILSRFARTVFAVDHSEEMLEWARHRCEQQGADNVQFICCALEDIPAELPVSCDCLLMHFVLHQLARPRQVIRAVSESLKPGGRLVIVDRTRHEDEEARKRFGSLWLGFDQSTLATWMDHAELRDFTYCDLPADEKLGSPGVFVAAGEKAGP